MPTTIRRPSWQTRHGPIKDNKRIQISTSPSDIKADWNRGTMRGQITINGKNVFDIINDERKQKIPPQPLLISPQKLAAMSNEEIEKLQEKEKTPFADIKELETFLKTHLLVGLEEDERESQISYIMKSTHQGGFLNPVSSYILEELMANQWATNLGTTTAFITTANGFIVQEMVTAGQLVTLQSDQDGYPILIKPESNDPQKQFVFKCQATLNVDLVSQEVGNPKISILNNGITYGNKEVESKLDRRNLWTKFVDWLKKKLGLTKVIDLATVEKPNTELSRNRPSM